MAETRNNEFYYDLQLLSKYSLTIITFNNIIFIIIQNSFFIPRRKCYSDSLSINISFDCLNKITVGFL